MDSNIHPHAHPADETRRLRVRLHKVVGQLQGVEQMLLESRDCADILTQLVSARRALKSLSEKLIQSHLHHCIENASDPHVARRELKELLLVLERYVE